MWHVALPLFHSPQLACYLPLAMHCLHLSFARYLFLLFITCHPLHRPSDETSPPPPILLFPLQGVRGRVGSGGSRWMHATTLPAWNLLLSAHTWLSAIFARSIFTFPDNSHLTDVLPPPTPQTVLPCTQEEATWRCHTLLHTHLHHHLPTYCAIVCPSPNSPL